MMQVGTNQSTTYRSQPSIPTSGGQAGRSQSTSSRQQQPQFDNEQLANIRPRICILRKWPHYDGYGVHLARNQHWLGLRIGDVEPNSPAESGGLLREDVVLAVNGHSVENDDFFVILSFIQRELEKDQIRFLVLDPHSADLARRQHLNIDENYRTCVRMETPTVTVSPEQLLYDQWRATQNIDPAKAQNTINLGPTTPLNQYQLNTNVRQQQKTPHHARDDIYTFLPYSDHAIENGKTYFEVLFDQDLDKSLTQEQRQGSYQTLQHSSDKNLTGSNRNLPGAQQQQQQQGPQNTTEYPFNKSSTGVDRNLPGGQQQQGQQNTAQYPFNKNSTDVDRNLASAQQQQQGPQNTTDYPFNKSSTDADRHLPGGQQQQGPQNTAQYPFNKSSTDADRNLLGGQQQEGQQNTAQYPFNKNSTDVDRNLASAQQQQQGPQNTTDYPFNKSSTDADRHLPGGQQQQGPQNTAQYPFNKSSTDADRNLLGGQQQEGQQNTAQYPFNKNSTDVDRNLASAQQQQQGPQNTTDYPFNKSSTDADRNLPGGQQQQGLQNTAQYPFNKSSTDVDRNLASAQQQEPQNTDQYPFNKSGNNNDRDLSSAQQQQQNQEQHPPGQNLSNKNVTGDDEEADFDDADFDEHNDKKRGSRIKDGIKNIVKTGVENVKSGLENIKDALPTRHHGDDKDKHDDKHKDDNKDKHNDIETKRNASIGSLENTPTSDDSLSLIDKLKNKIKGSDSLPHATDIDHTEEENLPPLPQGRFWETDKNEDTNNNLRPEPRMCSLSLRPGEPMGISITPDKDFGHIIKSVDPNSAADRAGIERDDCILSLNNMSLLNKPYDEVLRTLKEKRNDPNLDFLVAQKSHLLKSGQNNAALGTNQYDGSDRYAVTPIHMQSGTGDRYAETPETSRRGISDRYAETPVHMQPGTSDRYAVTPVHMQPGISDRYAETPVHMQPGISDRYAETPVHMQPGISDRYAETPVHMQHGIPDRYAQTPETARRGISDRYTDSPVNADAEVLPSSNLNQKDASSTVPASQTLEQLYNKYNTPQRPFNDDSNADRRSPHSDDERYPSKQHQGQILHGVGPATADRSSWGVSSGKSDEGFPRGQRSDDVNERDSSINGSFKPLQVGITNPTQQSTNTSGNSFANDPQRTSSLERDGSSQALPSPQNQSLQSLVNSVPTAPGTSSARRDYDQEDERSSPTKPDTRLGPTKVIGAPSKPIKTTQAMAVYGDTDDDDLSDISEKSHEEDSSDPVADTRDERYTELRRTPTDDLHASDHRFDDANKKSDFDKDSSVGLRKVIPARRLEQSDSEDTGSLTDSQAARQSVQESFYSPDESVDEDNDTDDQQSKLRGQHEQPPVNLIKASDNIHNESLSKFSNQQQIPTVVHDEDDVSSNESSSAESEYPRLPPGKMALATMPLSELKDYDYELHDIQLMQPTETSPVGLKLTKQQDPLQYVITAVAKGTKADLAGLKVNDWLIKIEDNDIRLVEFTEVSQDIRHLLTTAGFINMVIARKKSPTSTPVTKSSNKQQASSPPPSKIDSTDRQQAPTFMLTSDITRDTPDNNQVRFIPEETPSPPQTRSDNVPRSTRELNVNPPGGPLSVGLTNRISGDNLSKSPRSQSRSTSRSPTREFPLSQQQQQPLIEEPTEEYDPNEIRHITLKEALGLDFNSFIPESDSEIQTHFISNVQPSSMADKAGLRDGDRILTVNGVDVTNSIHEDVRRMMQSKKPLQLTVVNDPKYVELIENVKQNQDSPEGNGDKTRSSPPDYETVEQDKSRGSRGSGDRPPFEKVVSESGSESSNTRQKSESPKSIDDDLAKYLSVLFTDNKGPVYAKHCLLKKNPTYNGYGLLLRYQNGLHLIDQVEEDSPAYNSGLRENDVILFVDRKNVEQMTHDDVKISIRKLSLENTNIDLILLKKDDMPRYKAYGQNNSVDWKPILQDKLTQGTIQTEQQEPTPSRSSNDQTSTPNRSSSIPTNKTQAPAAPTLTTGQSTSAPPNSRVCILHPSPERTAGFALSGKSPPPYVIIQIEPNSPADKAGLRVNDVLLSINGKSVTETSYEDTVKLVKEALQQKSVELVVRDPSAKGSSQLQDSKKGSMGSRDTNTDNNSSFGGDPRDRGTNAVEEYQKQRNKELSYTLRLCHLHPTNGDGTQAATFGFELSEEPDYEYPLILRVEPHSSAEGAGLQSRDILLKINDRKTKGLGYDKVKKEIEKAKRDGRLEMLVVDQETFDYCKRTKKPLKEPEMKVKHVFPKSRSSASFHKLPIHAANAASSSLTSRDSAEQLSQGITKLDDDNNPSSYRTSVGYHLSTPRETDSENEDDKKQNLSEQRNAPITPLEAQTTRNSQAAVDFHLSPPAKSRAKDSVPSQETPLKFFDKSQTSSQQVDNSSTGRHSTGSTARSSISQTSNKESKGSKVKAIPNAINNLIHRIGHSKSSKPDYDAPPKTTVGSKARAPSPPTVRVGHNRLEAPRVSQSLDTIPTNGTTVPVSSIQNTVRSTVSTGSFDYHRGPRRCVLKVDRNKGLGFVLSATGDYDHTITAVEKYSSANIAGLHINDEILEVDGVDVRNVKYEQVVEMLVSAMRTNDTIEMRVIDGHSRDAYPSTINGDNHINSNGSLNSNNNNNNNNTVATSTTHVQRSIATSGDDLSDINSSISAFDSLNQQKIATSYPNLPGQLRQLDNIANRALSGSVPALATGITASPSTIHLGKSMSTLSEKGSVTKLSDISSQDAPVARLCRIRKFATSPFYGFFLCGDPKKLGRVFISDVTKHSPAAVCGLRDGDRIIEINGSTIDTLTYETILDKIKQHMAHDDLELLVLDKKSVHWYRERNYPITSRTLPTIVHIEPIINDTTSEIQSAEIPTTHTKMVGFADRRVSKTGL